MTTTTSPVRKPLLDALAVAADGLRAAEAADEWAMQREDADPLGSTLHAYDAAAATYSKAAEVAGVCDYIGAVRFIGCSRDAGFGQSQCGWH